MRILAIRGKNLASLAEPFEILLNSGPLEQAGLFAITGQTGAGKSTILDALCLALYDKIPRLPDGHGFAVGHKDEDESLRVVSTDVRSILRRGTSNAYAEVDFIGKDKHHYRARWEVSKARGKADGRLQAQEVTLSKIDDGQRIGQGKKNTLEKICELIDLNFDQFRRSVLLAQGDFAAFLKAKKRRAFQFAGAHHRHRTLFRTVHRRIRTRQTGKRCANPDYKQDAGSNSVG